ncbi:hypothetical protein ACTXT7_007801 [Hymenolepis weldensis]
MFQHFGTIKDPRFSKFRFGFPAGIYGSSIIPITIWFFHWDITEDGSLRVLNFGTLIPMTINWLTIVTSCDEIRFPRCSWAHFVNFVQPLQFDYELLEQSGTSPGISEEYMIPYVADGCWPIKSIEQASIIYIYAACIAYWKTPGFDRQICPNPCAKSPCSVLPYARAGSCQILGIHKQDFKCDCVEGFYWDSNAFSCVSENRCAMLCHPNNTATCIQDPKSLSLTCVCRLGYMGHDCSELLDACLIGSSEYDPADDLTAKPIVPAGKEACGASNKCTPRLGTITYICHCSEDYRMDRTLPYDNCAAKRDPCSNKICVEGWCISSEDGKQAVCECEDGFGGDQCDQQLGGWTAWSSWSSCEPFCGDQRLRHRIRVCSSEREEDCVGPLEQVEPCSDAEPCPAALSAEELEWQDFAEWFCLIFIISLAYILGLFCLLTLLSLIIPSSISTEAIIKQSLENRVAAARVPLKKPVCVHHCGDH